MLKRPRLKRATVTYLPDDEQSALLLTELQRQVFSDPIFRALIPLLDGEHTVQGIAQQLRDRHTLKDILGAIHLLQKGGYLVDAERFPVGQPAYWEAQGMQGQALDAAGVALRCFGQVSGDALAAALAGLGIATGVEEAALDIVLTDDYLRPELSDYNRQSKRPWLLARPAGLVPWLGPLFVPSETACWECLAHRLRQNRAVELFVSSKVEQLPLVAPVALPTTVGLVAQLAATHVAHWIAAPRYDVLRDTLFSWNIAGMALEAHQVVRRPQCPVCGEARAQEPKPIRLQRQDVHSTEGGYRSASPEETLARFGHHLSPLTGLVSGLEPVSHSDGIHVYRAKSIGIAASDSWHALQQAERFHAGGKGRTALQAKASAFCEALERYSSQRQGDEPTTRSSYAELGDAAIHPYAVVHFSPTQYRQREESNRRSRANQVQMPFDEQARIEWVKVWSLTRETWRYLPAAICYFNVRGRDPQVYFRGDSNGNAAGSSLEDAILQGFFELVERDCVAIWWYNRLVRPGVALAGIDDELVDALTRYYSRLGRRFWLLDITNDFGIPTFAALSDSAEGTVRGMSYGFGTHLDPRVAAIRALTEMNQLLPHILRHAEREDRRVPDAFSTFETLTSISSADEPCLLPAPDLPLARIADVARPTPNDIGTSLQLCMDRVHQLGMEVLVHDLTRPDVGLPVVKVIVPGMRHHWRRLAPGRLYDVPVTLGWLKVPLREDQLNPLDI